MKIMKKHLFTFLVWSYIFTIPNHLSAQTNCEKLKFLGLYASQIQAKHITVILSGEEFLSTGVYTEINLYLDNGDTLTNSNTANFVLPGSGLFSENTVAYTLPLHPSFENANSLPREINGTIRTRFPDCEVPFTKVFYDTPSLPDHSSFDCDDYQIIDVIARSQTLIPEGGNSGVLITYQNNDLLGLSSGYTDFILNDAEGNPLTERTSPSYYMPKHTRDTVFIPLKTLSGSGLEGSCFELLSGNPECVLNFCTPSNLTESNALSEEDLLIIPNPSSNIIELKYFTPIEKILILDTKGRQYLESSSPKVNIDQLVSGTYWVRVYLKDGQVLNKKFLKV